MVSADFGAVLEALEEKHPGASKAGTPVSMNRAYKLLGGSLWQRLKRKMLSLMRRSRR